MNKIGHSVLSVGLAICASLCFAACSNEAVQVSPSAANVTGGTGHTVAVSESGDPEATAIKPKPVPTGYNTWGDDVFALIPYDGEQAQFYEGSPFLSIDGGYPFFADEDLSTDSYEAHADLDDLHRPLLTIASIGPDSLPKEPQIISLEQSPPGFEQAKYGGEDLYVPVGLLSSNLTDDVSAKENVITGTQYFMKSGLEPFHTRIADYVKDSGNHVLYRATPVYRADEIVPRGVLLEAKSVEDGGEGILYCAFIYNVQPGVAINYATGESREMDLEQSTEQPTDGEAGQQPQPDAQTETAASAPGEQAQDADQGAEVG